MTPIVKTALPATISIGLVILVVLATVLTVTAPIAAAQTRRVTTTHTDAPVYRPRAAAAARKPATLNPQPQTPDTRTLTFDPTCAPGRRAVIAAVGDLLFHDALQEQALRPGHDFRAFWAPVVDVLKNADVTYGNLESPIAAGVGVGGFARKDPGRVLDRVVYGRHNNDLIFNTHPSVATDLATSGFDVVSTANNHSADRGSLGMDRTLDALEAAGLAHTGMRRATGISSSWSTRTHTRNGLSIAWLACTFSLNGIPDPRGQVRQCYRDLDAIKAELAMLAAAPDVDAVIFTPHWGIEGAPAPQASDRGLARLAIDAGATAVIGTHPHVLQPWEKHKTANGREGLIIYSTGNFISNQKSDDQRTGMIALIEITRPDGAAARLSAAGYIPTYVQMTSNVGHRVTELTTANGSTHRLPAGNRVSMARFRDLPRACDPAQAIPPAVASASRIRSAAVPALSQQANVDLVAPGGSALVAQPPLLAPAAIPPPSIVLPYEAPAVLQPPLQDMHAPEPRPTLMASIHAPMPASSDRRPPGPSDAATRESAEPAASTANAGRPDKGKPSTESQQPARRTVTAARRDGLVTMAAADHRPPPKRQPAPRQDWLFPARVPRADT